MRVWTAKEIVDIINENDDQCCKALLALYARQTDDEQVSATTKVHNGVGFTAYDAEILTSMAEGYKKYGRLTEKQLAVVRKKLVHYKRQLQEIANSN